MENTDTPKSALEKQTLTVDAHIDSPWIMTKYGNFDLRLWGGQSLCSFPQMAKGGLQSAIFSIYLPENTQDKVGDVGAAGLIDWQIRWLQLQTSCKVVDSTSKALDCYNQSEVPIFLGLEGGRLIHNSLDRLAELREKGIRYLTLTHNRNTDWADSATDVPKHNGLSPFGTQVVRACESLGILVDVSHTSEDTSRMVLAMAAKPVIASHSGCKALLNHPRNLSDVLVRSIVRTGGVVHIPFARRFIGPRKEGVADHIDHVVQLVGSVLHCGIGSDLDGAQMADGIKDVSCWWDVTGAELLKRGYKDEDVRAITGGNTLRLLA